MDARKEERAGSSSYAAHAYGRNAVGSYSFVHRPTASFFIHRLQFCFLYAEHVKGNAKRKNKVRREVPTVLCRVLRAFLLMVYGETALLVIPPVFSSYATPFRDGNAKVTFEDGNQKQWRKSILEKQPLFFLMKEPASIETIPEK